jgi:hypothetical protein
MKQCLLSEIQGQYYLLLFTLSSVRKPVPLIFVKWGFRCACFWKEGRKTIRVYFEVLDLKVSESNASLVPQTRDDISSMQLNGRRDRL